VILRKAQPCTVLETSAV